jgi:uncharacterized protein involved in exopolysaccharide biosynthesis
VTPTATPAVGELRPAEARRDVLLTVFKWHRLILAFGLVLMAVAAVAMLLQPAVATAIAKILIKTDRATLTIAGLPSAGSGRVVPQELLQSEVEFLMSSVVLRPVARALSAEEGTEDVSDGQLNTAIRRLRGALTVAPVPNSTVIQATSTASSVDEAERLLRMVVDSYVEQHAVAYSGSAALSSFFERETEQAATTLGEAEERLRQWQEANDVIAVDEQIAAQLATVGELEAALRRTEAEIDATRAHVAALTSDVGRLPRQAVTTREFVANPLVAQLRAELAAQHAALGDIGKTPVVERLRVDLATAEVGLRDAGGTPLLSKLRGDLVTAEVALHDLRQRYTDQDRRVQEKQEQIRRLQEGIAAAERDAVAAARDRVEGLQRELRNALRDAETAARERIASLTTQLATVQREGDIIGRETVAPHPLRENLNRDLATTRARLTSLVSQRDALLGQVQAARRAGVQLREKRVQFDRRARQVEVARALFMQNTQRLDDARIAAGLEKDQLTTVAVIEPPRGVAVGGGTRRTVLVALVAAVVGLALGVATALALEFFSWWLRTREDVEFYLGVPVLATVPALAGEMRHPRPLLTVNERARDAEAPEPSEWKTL